MWLLMDTRGVVRGRCGCDGCSCSEYERAPDETVQNCARCYHPPGQHQYVAKIEPRSKPLPLESSLASPITGDGDMEKLSSYAIRLTWEHTL